MERGIAWIKAQEGADFAGTFAGVVLAAHVFGMLVRIDQGGTPPQSARPPAMPVALKEAIARLGEAQKPAEQVALLRQILRLVEADLRGDAARRRGMPTAVHLDPDSGLTGTVAVCWRGQGWWRGARAARRDGAHAGPTQYNHKAIDELDQLWLHRVNEELPFGVVAQRGLRDRAVVTAMGRERLKVALCPLAGSAGPRFVVDEAGELFTARGEDSPCPCEHLTRVLARAVELGVDILLLPELSVRPADWPPNIQGPALVVGGSFHVEMPTPYNRAPVTTGKGWGLWSHDKRGYFRLTPAQVAGAGDRFTGPAPTVREVREGITRGGRMQVLDTNLGRFAVVICADAIDSDGGCQQAIREARPDFLLIVSYSLETEPFVRFAEEIDRLGISTLYVNAALPGCLWAMSHLSVVDRPADPPTRLRWRGGAEVEGRRPKGDWYKVDAAEGVRVDPLLGLVLDLGWVLRAG